MSETTSYTSYEKLFRESIDSRTVVFPSDPDREHSMDLLLGKTLSEDNSYTYRHSKVYIREQKEWTRLSAIAHLENDEVISFMLRGPLSDEDIAFMCFRRILLDRNDPESEQAIQISTSDMKPDDVDTRTLSGLLIPEIQAVTSELTNAFVQAHSLPEAA